MTGILAIGLLVAEAAAQTLGAEAPITEALPDAASGADFSVWGMFLRATLVVQLVMAILVLASFWSWATIIEKVILFRKLRSQSVRFEENFWSGQPLDDLFDRIQGKAQSPIERVFVAGMTEWRRSFGDSGLIPGTQQRVERAMSVAIAREAEQINRRLGFLASVGSVAPFVGLFGTVWGIKHSFESIAMQQNTNLAVVAPGIAEALLATALGLLAAIPAVLAYNRLLAEAETLNGGIENFADEFSTILARQIDRHRATDRPMSEINVTPFVDVMLVLLIIFMVTAPLLTTGVPVNLPKTNAAALPSEQQEPLMLTIDAKGGIYLQKEPQAFESLAEKLAAVRAARGPEGGKIYFRADSSLSYGFVQQVLAVVRNADFASIAMVHDQPRSTE